MTGLFRLMLPALAAIALALPATVFAAGAAGVIGPAFFVNGQLYRTVGTPTDVSATGAPAQSYDVIYALGGYQPDIATVAPGLTSYNSGRWEVHAITFNTDYATTLAAHDANSSGTLDSTAKIETALADGSAAGAMDTGIVRRFECPVIKLPASL